MQAHTLGTTAGQNNAREEPQQSASDQESQLIQGIVTQTNREKDTTLSSASSYLPKVPILAIS